MPSYTKRNGPRQLVASQALKFERVGSSLKLAPRTESLAPVIIGEGVELVGSRGYAQALPPCDENYALEDWGVTCALPFCDEVDYVEPCEPVSPPEGGEGWPPFNTLLDSVLTDPVTLQRVADVFTAGANADPFDLDSIPADSIGLFVADSGLGNAVYSFAVDSTGRVYLAGLDDGEDSYSAAYGYDADGVLVAVELGIASADGDTVLVLFAEELGGAQTLEEQWALMSPFLMATGGDTCSTEHAEMVSEGIGFVIGLVATGATMAPVPGAGKVVKTVGKARVAKIVQKEGYYISKDGAYHMIREVRQMPELTKADVVNFTAQMIPGLGTLLVGLETARQGWDAYRAWGAYEGCLAAARAGGGPV